MLHIYQQIYLIKNLETLLNLPPAQPPRNFFFDPSYPISTNPFIQNSPSCFGSDGSNRLALGQSPPLQAQPCTSRQN